MYFNKYGEINSKLNQIKYDEIDVIVVNWPDHL